MVTQELLKSFVPFNGLEDEYLQEACNSIEVTEYQRGQMIFKRGRSLSKKYFLLEGQVDLINSAFYVSTIADDATAAQAALNAESPCINSAVAKTPKVRVMSIDVEVLDRLIAWSQSMLSTSIDESYFTGTPFEVEELGDEHGDWMASLLQAPLFSKIPLTQVQELFARFEDVRLEKGDLVVKEGEPGDFFYVLVAGSARVFNRSDSVDLMIQPGHFFGEEALLGDTPRNASVEMLTPGHLKRLNADDFNALLKAPVVHYIEDRSLASLGKPYKLLDVKMPMEYRFQHLPGAINIPLSRLRTSMADLGRTNLYLVTDDAGSRADIAAHLLCQAGFEAMILKTTAEPTTESTPESASA